VGLHAQVLNSELRESSGFFVCLGGRIPRFFFFLIPKAKKGPAYKAIIVWTTGAGHGYEYTDEEAFDIPNQRHSNKAIENNSVVSILLETPKSDGMRYFDDIRLKTCQKTNTKGTAIGGIIPYYPAAKNETSEEVQGIFCDKWTTELLNS
jgi:hypothetical protein